MSAAGGGGAAINALAEMVINRLEQHEFLPEGLITLSEEYGELAVERGSIRYEDLPADYCFHVRCDNPRDYYTRFQVDKKSLSTHFTQAIRLRLRVSDVEWAKHLADLEAAALTYGSMSTENQCKAYLSLKAARWVASDTTGSDLFWVLPAYILGSDKSLEQTLASDPVLKASSEDLTKKRAAESMKDVATLLANKRTAERALAEKQKEERALAEKQKHLERIRAAQTSSSPPPTSAPPPPPPPPTSTSKPPASSPPGPPVLSDAEALRIRQEREAEEEGRKMRHQIKEAAREMERIKTRNALWGAQEMERREEAEKRRKERADQRAALASSPSKGLKRPHDGGDEGGSNKKRK